MAVLQGGNEMIRGPQPHKGGLHPRDGKALQQIKDGWGNHLMPKGQIKAGYGSLIGNAGEYAVVSELLKRQVIAALVPRNTRAFDILATKGGKTVRIRVKTKSADVDIWQWAAKRDGTIFPDLAGDPNDFLVLVSLGAGTDRNLYYVLPTRVVDAWLQKGYRDWLQQPGKRGTPHRASNSKRHLSHSGRTKIPADSEDSLKRYADTWDILWAEGHQPEPVPEP